MVLLFLLGQREEVIRRVELQIAAVVAVHFPDRGLAQSLVVPEELSLADEFADVLLREIVAQRSRRGQRGRLPRRGHPHHRHQLQLPAGGNLPVYGKPVHGSPQRLTGFRPTGKVRMNKKIPVRRLRTGFSISGQIALPGFAGCPSSL